MVVGAWNVLKYVSIGCFIWFAGALFQGDRAEFRSRSTPAQLVVVDVESKQDTDGYRSYRPIFALEGEKSPRQEYAGNTWTKVKPHEPGEIVSGRYDSENGEMRSDKMLGKTFWVARIAQIFGILVGLQAILIVMGFPEDRLPLRVRIRFLRQRPYRFRF